MLIVVFLCAVLLLAWFLEPSRKEISRKHLLLRKFPSPKKLPLIHNAWELRKLSFANLITNMESWKNSLGLIFHFTLHSFHSGLFVVTDPAVVGQLLAAIGHGEKSSTYQYLKGWLGDGLHLSTGVRWRKFHGILTSVLTQASMEDTIKTMDRNSRKLVNIFKAENGQPTDIRRKIKHFAVDTIFESAMGYCLNSLESSKSVYTEAMFEMMVKVVVSRMSQPLLKIESFYRLTSMYREEKKFLKMVLAFTQKLVDARKKELQEGEHTNASKCHLDALLKFEPKLSDSEILHEINSFIFGSHETSRSLLTFLVYSLAKHQEVQRKVYEEVMECVYENGGDMNKNFDVVDMSKLKYLEAVIKETLRLFPSAPFIARMTSEETTVGGYTFPKGAEVLFSAYLMGRDENNFPDPLTFDPNRFLDEDNINKASFIPFSGGKRPCIGKRYADLTAKVLISRLVASFKLELVDESVEPQLEVVLTLQSKTPINIKFIERNLS